MDERERPRGDRDEAMDGLTAVNLLLVPDRRTCDQARALNGELRRDLGWGYAFDETHQPHVTVLQRYVRRADLARGLAAVGAAFDGAALARSTLRTTGLSAAAFGTSPGTVLAGVDVEPTPSLYRLQEALLQAIGPFSVTGGDASAFFAQAGEPPIGPATIAYVEGFVPAHTGPRYAPHMTVGVGDERFVARLSSRFQGATFSAGALAAYQLGDLGTARLALMSWPAVSLAA